MSQSSFPINLLRALNGVRRGLLNSLWCTEARLRGIELGEEIIFNGRPYLYRFAGSTIRIGKCATLNSSLRSNPIGCSRPVSLRTLGVGAVIDLGQNVGLSGVSMCAAKSVTVGEGTFIGADTVIFDNDFHAPVGDWNWGAASPDNPRPVTIGRGVFIGARAIILKGVTIGDRAIVGAGAVVAKDVSSRLIVAGNPARVVGENK